MGRKRKYPDSDYTEAAIKLRRKHNNQARKTRLQNQDYRDKTNSQRRILYHSASFEQIVHDYYDEISEGPIHVCTSCYGLMFKKSMHCNPDLGVIKDKINDGELFDRLNLGPELCLTCERNLRKGLIPKYCHINFFTFPVIPDAVASLNNIELRLVSPRLPFFQYRSLSYKGQKGISGSILNVPMSVNSMVKTLPRNFSDSFIIQLKLKRKFTDVHDYLFGEVRPYNILSAMKCLVETPLYKKHNIEIDFTLFENSSERLAFNNEFDVDTIDDSQIRRVEEPNEQTLLVDTDEVTLVAPNQYAKSISLLTDHDSEELSFPNRFFGESRKTMDNQSYATKVKYEIRNKDRRFCNPENLFYMTRKCQLIHLINSIRTCMRKVKGLNLTASEAIDKMTIDSLLSKNECYRIFKNVRNTPFYWSNIKSSLLAKIRQYGKPTFFITLSSADLHWDPLLRMLKRTVDGVDISDSELSELKTNYLERLRLVRMDPVTTARYFDHRINALSKFMRHKNGVFSKHPLRHYFFRVEFQSRGSPHVHGMLWLDNVPESVDSKEFKDFINEYISCDSSFDELNVQVHHHTKIGCLRNNRCRFNIPFFPMPETIMLTPLRDTDDKFKNVLSRIHATLCSKEPHASFREFLEVIDLNYENYISAVRSTLKESKLFLRRSPQDVNINPFNPTLLKMHKGNMDFQYVADAHACAAYIASYISKESRGVSSLMNKALNQLRKGNEKLKEQLYSLAGRYLHISELCAQECAYYLLGMNLTKSDSEVIFINTEPRSKRTRILVSKEKLISLDADSTEIYENGLIERYIHRPKELEDWNLADFSALTSLHRCKNDIEEDSVDIPDDEVSDRANSKKLKFLDGSGYLTMRMFPRVIKHRPFSIEIEEYEFKKQQIKLYIPFRDEDKDIEQADILFLHKKHRERILESFRKYNATDIESLEKSLMDDEQNDDDQDPLDYRCDISNFKEAIGEKNNDDHECICVKIPNYEDTEYRDLIKILNAKQRKYLLKIISCIRGCEKFYHFVSGGAGTGKSLLIKAIQLTIMRFMRNMYRCDSADISVVASAFTGKAAYNIGANTLHGLFKLPLMQSGKDEFTSLSPSSLQDFRVKYSKLRVLIIDEISMIGPKIFNNIDARLRQIMNNYEEPFGGVSVICVGDLNQLPPVGDCYIFKEPILNSPYGPLLAHHRLWPLFMMYELDEIMRQKEDLMFAKVLQNFASNTMQPADKRLLLSRVVSRESISNAERCLRLAYTNNVVDELNATIFTHIPGDYREVFAQDIISNKGRGHFSEEDIHTWFSKLPLKETDNLASKIYLKIGAHYMIVKNIDISQGIVNGAVCVLRSYEVSSSTGEIIRLKLAHLDTNIQKTFELLPFETVIRRKKYHVSRKQFPIVLAEAMTIHKSQGSTYDKIILYVDKTCSKTAIYVALSRVTKLQGLRIVGDLRFDYKNNDHISNEYERLRKNELETPSLLFKEGESIMYYNIQSYQSNIIEVSSDPIFNNFQLICFSETRLMQPQSDLEHYKVIGFIEASSSRGGSGMMCLIKKDLDYEFISGNYERSEGNLEYFLIRFRQSVVLFIYASPKISSKNIINICKATIETYRRVIILGDFNISTHDVNPLTKFFYDNNMRKHIAMPTTDYFTTIDNAFSNIDELRGGVYESILSYHRPIYVYGDI